MPTARKQATRPVRKPVLVSHQRDDIYTQITDRIVASLEKGVAPWFKPWTGEDKGGLVLPLRYNGEPYSGINVLMLWMTADERGYTSPHWMTYKQAQEFGGQVRKGEHGTPVVHAGKFTIEGDAEDGSEDRMGSYLKTYIVFNVEQIDGLPDKYKPAPVQVVKLKKHARVPAADAFFEAVGATVNHGGNKAFYRPSTDTIQLPVFGAFNTAADYYCTRGHETVHWTNHKSRLDRDLGRKRWGDDGYAMEELVAEIGAAFLMADLGIAAQPRKDHAEYIAHWLRVMRGDKKAIFSAARLSQAAVTFLHKLADGKRVERRAAA